MVALLECSINGSDIQLAPAAGSKLAALHDEAATVTERTTCNYGLNTDLARIAETGGLAIGGIDELGEVRAVELIEHPYFVATLYQPQLRSSAASPHPIFTTLIERAAERAEV